MAWMKSDRIPGADQRYGLRKCGSLANSGVLSGPLLLRCIAQDPSPGFILMKGVNKVGRNLALPKSSGQFSKCHCLCALPSALDLRLFCFQPESVPFLASLFPAVSRHRASPSHRAGP